MTYAIINSIITIRFYSEINADGGEAAALAAIGNFDPANRPSGYSEIHTGQGKQARFIICRATLFAKIMYSRDDHCNLGYVFPGVDGGDDGGDTRPRARGVRRRSRWGGDPAR